MTNKTQADNMNIAKSYVRIDHYGKLLIPTNMLEKLLEHAFVADTDYVDGKDVLSKLEQIDRVKVHSADEVKGILMHQELGGNSD